MQEAGPLNFLRTILIILVIYYIIKFLAKYIAPVLLKRYINKMQERAQQYQGGQPAEPDVKEGETIIDKTPRKTNQSSKNVGEYVDYEEID